MMCPVSQVMSVSPRMQTWPPAAQPTAVGTALLRIILGRTVEPQMAGFSLAPKNLAVGDRFL